MVPYSALFSAVDKGVTALVGADGGSCRLCQHILLSSSPSPRCLPLIPCCRLNTLYLEWADMKGVDCEECRTLSALFARGVDSVKSGEQQRVPNWLMPATGSAPGQQGMGPITDGAAGADTAGAPSGQTAEEGPPASSANDHQGQREGGNKQRIWRLLMEQAREASVAFRQGQLRSLLSHHHDHQRTGSRQPAEEAAAVMRNAPRLKGFDSMAILGLIHSSDICLSEYALLRLIARWCAMQGKPLVDFARLLDFDRLSHLQVRGGRYRATRVVVIPVVIEFPSHLRLIIALAV